MFGKAKDLAKMLKNAKALQGNMEKLKSELAKSEFSANVAGVTMTVNGSHQIVKLSIPDSLNKEQREQAVIDAHRECINQISKASEAQIKKLGEDLNIEDLLD